MRLALVGLGVASIVIASWLSWVGVGSVCTNGHVTPGSPAAVVCDVGVSRWHGSFSTPPSALDELHDLVGLLTPIAIFAIAAVVGLYRRELRPFRYGFALALVVLVVPWLALLVLPGSTS